MKNIAGYVLLGCVGFVSGIVIFDRTGSDQKPAPMPALQIQLVSSQDAAVPPHQADDQSDAPSYQPRHTPNVASHVVHPIDPSLATLRNQVQDDLAKQRCLPTAYADITCWARVMFRSGDDTVAIDAILLAGCWTTIDQNERDQLPPATIAEVQRCLTASIPTLPSYARSVATPGELDLVLQ